MPVPLPDGLLELLRRPNAYFLATVIPEGSPRLTQTWVTQVLINTVEGFQKTGNVARRGHLERLEVCLQLVYGAPDSVDSYRPQTGLRLRL